MALKRELIRRLESDEEPLSKRLRLAERVFQSVDLPILQRETVILRWLCNEQLENHETSWETLKHCLLFYNDAKVILKSDTVGLLTDAFIRVLDNCSLFEECLECIDNVLSNTGTWRYFQEKLEIFATLTSRLLSKLGNDESGNMFRNINFSLNVLRCVENVYRLSSSKNQVANVFVNTILPPLHAVIINVDSPTNKLYEEAQKFLQTVFFHKSRREEYMKSDESNTECVADSLFSALKRHSENLEIYVFLFEAAVNSYMHDIPVLVAMLRKFVESAEDNYKEVFILLMDPVEDVNFPLDSEITETTLSYYLTNLMDRILVDDSRSELDYSVISNISSLNPLILESKLLNIFKKVLLRERSTTHEKRSYEEMLIAVLQNSIRLNRQQKIVSIFLQALKCSLEETKKCNLQVHDIIPMRVLGRFTETITEIIQSSSVIKMLETLKYHFKADCVDVIGTKYSRRLTLLLEVTTELLSAFFHGIRVFEYTVPVGARIKFINDLGHLGDSLIVLNEKICQLEHNERITTVFLSLMLSWNRVYDLTLFYSPKSVSQATCSIVRPDSTQHWQQLLQRIRESGEEASKTLMNKIILHRMHSAEGEIFLSSVDFLDDLKYCWKDILESKVLPAIVISAENALEISSLMLKEIEENELTDEQWRSMLYMEAVQENRALTTAILCQVLRRIGLLFSTDLQKATACFDETTLLKSELSGSEEIPLILEKLKLGIDDFSESNNVVSREEDKVEKYLDIFLRLPLPLYSVNLRRLAFVMTFLLQKECHGNETLVKYCDAIFSELAGNDIDIFKYISPISLFHQMKDSGDLMKLYECSLQTVNSYEEMKNFVAEGKRNESFAAFLLKVIEKIERKLNSEDQKIMKKAEKKLGRILLNSIKDSKALDDSEQVKKLTLAFKVGRKDAKISEEIRDTVKSALPIIFSTDKTDVKTKPSNSKFGSELMKAGLELAGLVLETYGSNMGIEDEIMRNVWLTTLNFPNKELSKSMFHASKLEMLRQILSILYEKTCYSFATEDEDSLDNILIVCNSLLEVSMSNVANKIRSKFLYKLLESLQVQPVASKHWPAIVELLQKILSSRYANIGELAIDMSFCVSIRALTEGEIEVCEGVLSLCRFLVKVKTDSITGRLPALFVLYRQVMELIVTAARSSSSDDKLHHTKCLAIDMEKYTAVLIKQKKHVVRVVPYIIADILSIFSEGVIPSEVKEPLDNSVDGLISVCDQHGISLLSRSLPSGTQEVFKSAYARYNKYKKFTGKI